MYPVSYNSIHSMVRSIINKYLPEDESEFSLDVNKKLM